MRAPAKASLVVALFSVCALATTTCTRKSAPGYFGTVVPKHGPDEIWINGLTEPEYIDPGKCADAPGGALIPNMFAGLVQPHPKTLEPMPDLARGWKVSEDGRVYTFKLRQSTWSDGHPLTAHDFVYAWKRVLDPKTASKYGTMLYLLENGDAFNQRALWITGLPAGATNDDVTAWAKRVLKGKVASARVQADRGWAFVFLPGTDETAPDPRPEAMAALGREPLKGTKVQVQIADGSIVGVRALDDHTLEARLGSSVPYFLSLAMFYTLMPVPRHVIEPLVARGLPVDGWTRPEHIVSNGPYVLKQWRFRREAIFERNERYWDTANTKIRRVRVLMVDDENTALNMYKTGDLDWIGEQGKIPVEFVDHLRGFRDYHVGPHLAVYFYWVNTKRPPMDNPLVRRALSLAIDREGLARYVTRAGEIPSADLVPDGLTGYRGLKTPVFDPARARALLRQAGFPEGRGLPRITLTYNTLEQHRLIAQAVQQMWRKHLGVQVDLENQEWKVYLKNLDAGNFQLGRLGWVGDYPDPYTFLELLIGANPNNRSQWTNPEYERLLEQANGTVDRRARLDLFRRAEKIASDETPLIPLYIYSHSDVIKPYVRGHRSNYQNRHPWKHWRIDERFYAGGAVPQVPFEDPAPPMITPEAVP
jgi:oligopeptide transport system substrate-binding protein